MCRVPYDHQGLAMSEWSLKVMCTGHTIWGHFCLGHRGKGQYQVLQRCMSQNEDKLVSAFMSDGHNAKRVSAIVACHHSDQQCLFRQESVPVHAS